MRMMMIMMMKKNDLKDVDSDLMKRLGGKT